MSDGLRQVLPGFDDDNGPTLFGQSPQGRPQYHFQPPQGRRGLNRYRKQKKRKKRRSIVVLVLAVLLVGGGIFGAYVGIMPLVHKLSEPNDYTGTGTTAVTVKVPDGASGQRIAGVLAQAGVVKTQQAFVDELKANPRSGQVQPGTYTLKKQMSAASALTLMLDPKSLITHLVVIKEGERLADIYRALHKDLGLSTTALATAGTSGEIGLPAAAKNNPEGFLFPATYSFDPDTTASEALSAMVARGRQTWTSLGIKDDSLRSVIIQASIVQAEAGNQKYMGPIARVLNNRLRKHWKLQLDSTVSYFTHRFGVTTTTAERARKSPYNTYQNYGLPAGPIGNPGEAAIEAVLNPTPGPWLFFVTTDPSTGLTKFSTTKAQHDAYATQLYNWLHAHPGA